MRMCPSSRRFSLAISGLILSVLLLFALSATAAERTVARITDLQGTAALLDDANPATLRILARVREGSRIQLDEGSKLTLHYPGSHTDFRFQGPDTIVVESQRAISETSVAETKTHSDIGVTLDLANTDLGAIAMRSIGGNYSPLKALGPMDTRVLLGKPVEFRWQAPAGNGLFNVVLSDAAGKIIHNQTTAGTSLTLPTHIKLQPGRDYRWQVSAVGSEASATKAEAEFSTAPTEIEARYYRMIGLKTGTLSDLVLYALYLDGLELHEEALETWRYLESQRPGIQSQRGL